MVVKIRLWIIITINIMGMGRILEMGICIIRVFQFVHIRIWRGSCAWVLILWLGLTNTVGFCCDLVDDGDWYLRDRPLVCWYHWNLTNNGMSIASDIQNLILILFPSLIFIRLMILMLVYLSLLDLFRAWASRSCLPSYEPLP